MLKEVWIVIEDGQEAISTVFEHGGEQFEVFDIGAINRSRNVIHLYRIR